MCVWIIHPSEEIQLPTLAGVPAQLQRARVHACTQAVHERSFCFIYAGRHTLVVWMGGNVLDLYVRVSRVLRTQTQICKQLGMVCSMYYNKFHKHVLILDYKGKKSCEVHCMGKTDIQ